MSEKKKVRRGSRSARDLQNAAVNLDRERRKMEQEIQKRSDASKKALEKEQRKMEKESKALDMKRQKFLKEKNDVEALKRQLLQEKDIFLNRARKAKIDGPTVLKEMEAKILENTNRKHEADQEWGKIKEERDDMKKEEAAIKKERDILEADKVALAGEREEFAARVKELEEKEAANTAENERLTEWQTKLTSGEEAVAARGKEYDMLDMKMKDRELDVTKRDAQLKLERSQMDDLKKNLYNVLLQNKKTFNDRYALLGEEIQRWNGTFDALFKDVGEEVPAPAEEAAADAAAPEEDNPAPPAEQDS